MITCIDILKHRMTHLPEYVNIHDCVHTYANALTSEYMYILLYECYILVNICIYNNVNFRFGFHNVKDRSK